MACIRGVTITRTQGPAGRGQAFDLWFVPSWLPLFLDPQRVISSAWQESLTEGVTPHGAGGSPWNMTIDCAPMKHIILGAGGAISKILSRELIARGQSVRLVSRNGREAAGTESVRADLLDPGSMQHAVDEGSTVYLLAGLPYRTAVWQAQWPRIMRNTIEAVASRDARLIFFDNVYMYGRVDGVVEVRAPVRSPTDSVQHGNREDGAGLPALIARPGRTAARSWQRFGARNHEPVNV